MDKSPAAFRTISEVAQDLSLPQHVLRFWETRFAQIKPLKRGGGRRYYRPEDIELLRSIRHLLYADGYTIKGVQRLLREHGARAVAAAPAGSDLEPPIRRHADDAEDAVAAHDPATAGALPPTEDLQALFGAALASPPASGHRAATPGDRARLQAVLAELTECERLLTAARSL